MADLQEILKKASIKSRELAGLIRIIEEAVDFDDVRKIDKYHFWQGFLKADAPCFTAERTQTLITLKK
jgi:hypothetical protein